MRRIKALALAALLLLGLTSAASAECAWVLWERLFSLPATEWSVLAAWPTYEACQSMTFRYAAGKGQQWNNIRGPDGLHHAGGPKVTVEGPQVTVATKSDPFDFTYVCFPDTVDPRGAKGK